jgi:hypothetical protein
MGAFEIILSDLNRTDSSNDLEVNIENILVLGSAMQRFVYILKISYSALLGYFRLLKDRFFHLSNPKVKIFAIKTDLLQYILNKLSSAPLANTIMSQEFSSKLIFALSGLIRNFPFAQSQFIRYGGVETLSKLIQNSSSIKLKTKILTLIDDLLKEKVIYNHFIFK